MFITIVLLLSTILIGSASVYFLGNDNHIEEASEEVIEDITGEDIDLSPEIDDTGKEA